MQGGGGWLEYTLTGAAGAVLATVATRIAGLPKRWRKELGRRLDRLERKVGNVESVARAAAKEVGYLHDAFTERSRHGGQRWYDPSTPKRNRELYDQDRRGLDP